MQESSPELRAAGLTLPASGAGGGDGEVRSQPGGRARGGRSWRGWIEYRRDLFEPATIRRLAGHLGTLLAARVAAPGGAVSALPLLSAQEREQLADWHPLAGHLGAAGTVHDLFEEAARLRPEAAALVAGEQRVTYGELAQPVGSRWRASLRRLGVGPEVRVGLAAERSPELVVGILAILRAGGALVPLDPAHPAERLALLLEDSGLSAVVTQAR